MGRKISSIFLNTKKIVPNIINSCCKLETVIFPSIF